MTERAPRQSRAAVRTLVCESAAYVVLEDGIEKLSPTTVALRAGIHKGRVVRIHSNSVQLAAAIRRTGYERVEQLCEKFPRSRDTGVSAIAACLYELVEQAGTDAVVRAMYALDAADAPAAPGHFTIYGLWRSHFMTLLNTDLDGSPTEDTSVHARLTEVADVLVDALAGFTTPRGAPSELPVRFDHVHLLLTAVLPMVCSDADYAAHMHQYLPRLRRMYGTRVDDAVPH
ncbi:hypothetical protein DK926_19435 [Rhodococcus sp. Eu-32]|uniref:hypothetical protein n=1 Tax=Rhodococcus sp. Eu-32 TaxID=1017319 RepID=UPI000F795F70|nr:hypothetical protein [Rhodococcus sp. Eu-32]RRQ26173.1 hypothetical protein DK926_19435 [Rhodococcus sp. Eu-32]